MCGLFGWHLEGTEPEATRAFAAVLMSESVVRGRDSWGVLNVQSGEIVKEVGKATAGLRHVWQWPFAMGHTRFASVGAVTVENAHPWRYKNIVGAHNGSIRDWQELNKKHNRDFAVDSWHLFAHIADGLPLKELVGYGAVTYVDVTRPASVYLGKFNGGSLHVFGLKCEQGQGIVWASDEKFIELALDAAGWDGFEWILTEGRLFEIAGFTLYKTTGELPITSFSNASQKRYDTQGGYESKWNGWKPLNDGRNKSKRCYSYTRCDWCSRWAMCETLDKDQICSGCLDEYNETVDVPGTKPGPQQPEPCDWCRADDVELVEVPEWDCKLCLNCYMRATTGKPDAEPPKNEQTAQSETANA